MTQELADKRVLVIGLGLHGGAIGTIEYLASKGARITVTDKKTAQELASSQEKLSHIPGIAYSLGVETVENISDFDMVIRNPAVPRTSPILAAARENNIPIEMDSSLFFQDCPSLQIIGITGSKGKTTCSNAIAGVLTELFPDTVAVGIDGVSPLGMLPNVTVGSRVVFELSSWRLEALQEHGMSPHIAVVTSIYQDHLNTYSSYEEYIETKKQIIKNQTRDDIAILNADDEILRSWKYTVRGTLYWFSLEPLKEGKGIWVENDMVYTNIHDTNEQLCAVSTISHVSPHELRNKLPSLLIALLYGAKVEAAVAALSHIAPLAHRMQTVRMVDGATYMNDSAATMPDAAIAAITALAGKRIVLIAGGSDKALEFHNLANTLASANISHIIWLPGTATERMKSEIMPHTQATPHDASSMEEAVRIASESAQNGDIVLLSPGATSFGLFLHEFDRGDSFIRAVEALSS